MLILIYVCSYHKSILFNIYFIIYIYIYTRTMHFVHYDNTHLKLCNEVNVWTFVSNIHVNAYIFACMRKYIYVL